eukprot:TRINITY_DN991_c0_g2_i1.p1 TRINITY_DN991_c0_g2~~TRINITY_DN991_c0_g2_i1.p1  ORF type:complete len:536 (+),score=167.55 TRINITY_DN991_c0_g2_i1:49-1608(+)
MCIRDRVSTQSTWGLLEKTTSRMNRKLLSVLFVAALVAGAFGNLRRDEKNRQLQTSPPPPPPSTTASTSTSTTTSTTTGGNLPLPGTTGGTQTSASGSANVEVRGQACLASDFCNKRGCLELTMCRCQAGYSGLRCEFTQAEMSVKLSQGSSQSDSIKNRGPPRDASAAAQIAADIGVLARNQNAPLQASNLKDLTTQMDAAVSVDKSSRENLKALVNLGQKMKETTRRDDTTVSASGTVTADQQAKSEQEKRDTLRATAIAQIKLFEKSIKGFTASQRSNLNSGAEASIEESGLKGIYARLDFSACAGNSSNCGPPPSNKPNIPDPPKDKITSATFKFSIQNPEAANLGTDQSSNATAISATASQQAYVHVPQSIGLTVKADAQFSFTATANSFVPNLSTKKYFGASAVYSVGFADSNGNEVAVHHLAEPVRLCAPTPAEVSANSSLGAKCAYINPNKTDDVETTGVETDTNSPSGMTCCYLSHFSSFTIVAESKSSFLNVLTVSMGAFIVAALNFLI